MALLIASAGEQEEDLDTTTWTLAVRRSWTEPIPKDGDPREVVVVPELRASRAAAITASRSDLVLSRPDGSPFPPAGPHTAPAFASVADRVGALAVATRVRRDCARAAVSPSSSQ